MDPNFQSRYLESTDEAGETVDPLAEPQLAPPPTLDDPSAAEPVASYRPEDQYTEILPAVAAAPPRHAAEPAARSAPPAAAGQWGTRPAA